MPPENVLTHLIISVVCAIPAILAGVASVMVSLRQLKQAQSTHSTVNGRVDQLVAAREEKARLEERIRQWQEAVFTSGPPAIVTPKREGQ